MSSDVRLEKVVLNIGVGSAGEELDKAMILLERITGQKPVKTLAKKRVQPWGIRKGLPIGCKVTLRKDKAKEVLKKLFEAVENRICVDQFDKHGNLSFGIREYIDIPGMKYDPDIGMYGMDVCVSFTKLGKRVKLRRIKPNKKIKVFPTKEEVIEYLKNNFGVEFYERGNEEEDFY